MTDLTIETESISQNITQAIYMTYLQTPIITDTLPCLIVGIPVTRVGW